jgi:hypothetical protein
MMRGGESLLPPTVADQIRLWEQERDRFVFTEGVLYNQFLSQADYETVKNYADQLGKNQCFGSVFSLYGSGSSILG